VHDHLLNRIHETMENEVTTMRGPFSSHPRADAFR
jgi:hypothetical protein